MMQTAQGFGLLRKKPASSVYKETLCTVEKVRIPSTPEEDLTAIASISMIKLKSRGDRVHPCLTPLVILSNLEFTPKQKQQPAALYRSL